MNYRGYEIDILEEQSGFSVNVIDGDGVMVYEAYEFHEAIDAKFDAKVAIDRKIEDGYWVPF